jgi:hypothetical protein
MLIYLLPSDNNLLPIQFAFESNSMDIVDLLFYKYSSEIPVD